MGERDLLDEIVAADQAAAAKRERKERRVFRIATGALVVLAIAVGLTTAIAFKAMANQGAARAAASRRIDILNDQIEILSTQVAAGNLRIGELTEQVAALQEQVRQLGGDPVVVIEQRPPTTSTTN